MFGLFIYWTAVVFWATNTTEHWSVHWRGTHFADESEFCWFVLWNWSRISMQISMQITMLDANFDANLRCTSTTSRTSANDSSGWTAHQQVGAAAAGVRSDWALLVSYRKLFNAFNSMHSRIERRSEGIDTRSTRLYSLYSLHSHSHHSHYFRSSTSQISLFSK